MRAGRVQQHCSRAACAAAVMLTSLENEAQVAHERVKVGQTHPAILPHGPQLGKKGERLLH